MGQVVVSINDRPYAMTCDDGQEEHLTSLGRLLDVEVQRIRNTVGQVGEARLLLMAGLVIADRLSEAERRIAAQDEESRKPRSQAQAGREAEEKVAQRLDAAARRLEALARETRGD